MTLEIVPANEVSGAELARLFGTRGPAATCRCQRYRLARGETFANTPVEERALRLRDQAGCGNPSAPTTGLVARRDGEPVGWCAVAPRASHAGLVRNGAMAAWAGRDEDRHDPGVWAITCVYTRPGARREGVGSALVRAAVDFARTRGATKLEGYPIDEHAAVGTENHPGLLSMYRAAGFEVVHKPSKRRTVVAVTFSGSVSVVS